ncbi:hypothetical protein C8R43DRAFT_1237469 [Mycena crocata]|nr:hypothetical protein C8R43DRAFT_1237469 [Mycena crocata]
MKGYSNMLRICVFLIEQHSDPNEMHKGVSLLHFACLIGSWDLICALLLHDAKASNDNPSKVYPVDMFQSSSDKARFTALTSEYSNKARPPHPCPCASGIPLSQCHATDQPYHICPCFSRKTYAKCCQKRTAVTWHEKWTDETQFHFVKKLIRPIKFIDPAEQTQFIAKVKTMSKAEQREKLLPTPEGTQEALQLIHAVIKSLAFRGKIDRAFAEATEKTGYFPRPGRIAVTSKHNGKGRMDHWNRVVDDYIASGADHRGRTCIEDAAKIAVSGGPLYRRCEADACSNVEGRNSVKLLVCSGCLTTVYCSKSCQKSGWTAHKSACRARTAKVQVLPSQLAYFEEVARVIGLDLS